MSATDQRARSYSLSIASRLHRSSLYKTAKHKQRDSKQDDSEHGLTDTQVEAFREVFGLFDVNGGGTIDAQELHSALKSVDIHLTKEEIEDVLCVMDEDGNGEVDFEEFLTLMTSTEKYLEALGGEKEDKESLLFSALTKFMMKSALSSMAEIERYYNAKVRKSPHVVGHYAAGARLIGLTEKQMAQHLATLNQSGDENSDSPYAQPVCLFNSPPASTEKDSRKGKIRLRIINKKFKDPNDTEERSAVGEKTEDSAMCKPSASSASAVTRSKTPTSCMSPMCLRPQISVKLPAISMSTVQKNPDQLTIEDLPTIRSQVQRAYNRFYTQQQSRSRQCVNTFADMSQVPQSLQLPFLLILTAYGVKPVNIPHRLRLRLAQQRPWQQDLPSIVLD